MAKQITYTVKVDGATASATVLDAIQRIEIEDHATMAGMLRLRLAVAVKEDGSGWTLLDDTLFTRLAKLDVSVTVGSGEATPLISAYVIDVDAQLSSEPDGSTLTIVAMDPTVLMHLEEKVKAWPNMMDSDVASAIFSGSPYQFTPVVESTGWSRQEDDHTLIQRGTDIQFLQELAGRNGYECFVALNEAGRPEGHFHPPKYSGTAQGTLTINMGTATNVDKFHAKFDMLGPALAKAVTIDPDDASAQSGQADESSKAGPMGSSPATPSDRPRRLLLSRLGMAQAGEVQRYAQAVADRSAWAIVAEGEVNTVAFGGVLKAKQPVMVRGAGRVFSGRYYAHRVRHTITGEGSYVQTFTLRRNAVGLTGQESFRSDDAAGVR